MSIVDIARGSHLQRLQSWSHRGLRRLRSGARSALDRRSDQLAHLDGRLHRWLEGGYALRDAWSAAIAVTGAVRKLTAAALPRGRKPSPERTRATVPPAFVCDRALVESMRL